MTPRVTALCRQSARLRHRCPDHASGDPKHLRVMEHAGLVRSVRRGRKSVWQVERKRLADARRHLQQISVQWDETLDGLKRHVER
jgi:hypothetical protein